MALLESTPAELRQAARLMRRDPAFAMGAILTLASLPSFAGPRNRATSPREMAAISPRGADLTGIDEPERLQGNRAMAGLSGLPGARQARGAGRSDGRSQTRMMERRRR